MADDQDEARARLESEYLSGAISADEYTRRRRELHEEISEVRTAVPVAEVRLASWGRRAAALLLDLLLLLLAFGATSVLGLAAGDLDKLEAGLALEILLLPSLYLWLMIGAWGQTLGKMALGVRVVRAEDAGPVGYARALGRVGSLWALWLSWVGLPLAYLWPLWDERNQTLYDKFVRTIVVRVG